MTTAELRRYIDANGLEPALRRFEDEPTDNPETAEAFTAAYKAMKKYDRAAARLVELLEAAPKPDSGNG
jgi:hypothetical protein